MDLDEVSQSSLGGGGDEEEGRFSRHETWVDRDGHRPGRQGTVR